MHGRVARRSPAGAAAYQTAVIDFADHKPSGTHSWPRHLTVTAQAKVLIGLREHAFVDRTVRLMTGGTAFAHGRMFEDDRPHLFPMTRRARLIHARHG